MSIKSELWNRVLDFTSKKQPVFAGVYQAASDCTGSSCYNTCSGGCNNTCIKACEDSSTNGPTGGW